MIRETTIGEAWADVEAHMPEAWVLRGVTLVHAESKRAARRGEHWRAVACRRTDLGLSATGRCGIGQTPAAALTRLADLLSGVGSGSDREGDME